MAKTQGLPVPVLMIFMALAPLPINADYLITREGKTIETKGPWEVKGKLVIYTSTHSRGTLSSMRLSEIDLEASKAATRKAAKPVPPPPGLPPVVLASLKAKIAQLAKAVEDEHDLETAAGMRAAADDIAAMAQELRASYKSASPEVRVLVGKLAARWVKLAQLARKNPKQAVVEHKEGSTFQLTPSSK